MLRTILAPIAGLALFGVLVVFTDQLLSLLTQGFNPAATPQHSYDALRLLTDGLYSFMGGYCCAALARVTARTAMLILIVCGELVVVVSVIASWARMPHWFSIGLLLVYPPAVWAGSRFRMRGEPSGAEV